MSLIPARTHILSLRFFIDIFYGHSPLSADSRRTVIRFKQKCVQRVLVNHLVKLAQESVVRLTDPIDMTITLDLGDNCIKNFHFGRYFVGIYGRKFSSTATRERSHKT